MDLTATQRKGLLLVAWGVTFLLSFSGPVIRAATGVSGSGRWSIYAAAGAMLICWLCQKPKLEALVSAISMSASAIAAGGALGLAAQASMTGKLLPLLLAAKWAGFAIVLCFFFRKELRDVEREIEASDIDPEQISESLRTMSPDDRRAFFEEMTKGLEASNEQLQRRMRRLWIQAGILVFIGILAFASAQILMGQLQESKRQKAIEANVSGE